MRSFASQEELKDDLNCEMFEEDLENAGIEYKKIHLECFFPPTSGYKLLESNNSLTQYFTIPENGEEQEEEKQFDD